MSMMTLYTYTYRYTLVLNRRRRLTVLAQNYLQKLILDPEFCHVYDCFMYLNLSEINPDNFSSAYYDYGSVSMMPDA